jgi:hypothetical protein
VRELLEKLRHSASIETVANNIADVSATAGNLAAILAAPDHAADAHAAKDATLAAAAGIIIRDFPTRTAASSSTIPTAVTHLRTGGFADASDGGGAVYYRKPAPEVDRPGDFTTNGGTVRWGLAKQFYNIRMFGALPDNADNRQAIQDALDFAKFSRQMHLTGGHYQYTISTANVPTFIGSAQITGDGQENSVFVFSIDGSNGGDTATIDGLRIHMLTQDYGSFKGHVYKDFAVHPAVPGTGRNAIRWVLGATSFLANFLVDGVTGGDTRRQGLFFDNSANNLDGFFVGRVRNIVSINGCGGIKMGDSIAFYDCQFTAGTLSVDAGIDQTGVPGARQYLHMGHNLTSRAGAAKFVGVDQLRFMFHQCEHNWWTGDGKYIGDTDALISVKDCLQPWIVGNTGGTFYGFTWGVASGIAYDLVVGSKVLTLHAGYNHDAVLEGDIISGGGVPNGAVVVGKSHNQIELDMAATATTANVFSFARTLTDHAVAYALLVDGNTNMAIVEYNDFARGRVAHMAIAAGAKNTYIGLNHYYGNINPEIHDGGQGTMGVPLYCNDLLQNSWTPAEARPVKRHKDKDKKVLLWGEILGGSTSNVMTLPVGFHPDQPVVVLAEGAVDGNDSIIKVSIATSGALSVQPALASAGTTVTRASLDGISFYAPLVA